MSVNILQQARKHPARDAAMQSIDCVQNKNREGWLALWDENGVLEDPVGASPLDPEGNGHRGSAAIKDFYDNVIAAGDLRFCIRQTFAGGNECANVGTITTRAADGTVGRTELIVIYRVNEAGKIISLRAFWDFDATAESMF